MNTTPPEASDAFDPREVTIKHEGNVTRVKLLGGEIDFHWNLHQGGLLHRAVQPTPVSTGTPTALETFDRWSGNPKETVQLFAGDSMYDRVYAQKENPLLLLTPHISGARAARERRLVEGGLTLLAAPAAAEVLHGARTRMRKAVSPPPEPGEEPAPTRTRKVARRTFLAALAAFGVSPLAAGTSSVVTTQAEGGHDISATLNQVSDKMHPELQALFPDHKLFAAIVIHKLEWLLENGYIPNGKIAMIVGGNHEGDLCDPSLYDPSTRIEYIASKHEFLKDAIDPLSLSGIAIFPGTKDSERYARSLDQVIRVEVPDLQELMNTLIGTGNYLNKYPIMAAALERYAKR